MRRIVTAVFALALAFSATAGRAAADDDAWPLYKRAGERIAAGDQLGKSSPSASNLQYAGYPPFSAEWERMARTAYEHNAEALADVRRATAMTAAAWPVERVDSQISLKYLSGIRNIANEVGDAGLYEFVRGDHAAAVARVRDVLHIADLLDAPADRLAVQMLVAVGIRALALDRLMTISANVRLADATGGGDATRPGETALPVADVEALIKRLFTNDVDFDPVLDKVVANERAADPKAAEKPLSVDKFKVQLQRAQTERNLAAMALACRLFQHRNQRWPASADELARLLPARPVDVHGPMGYALVKGGLPDAGDRPLVYSLAGVPADGGRPRYPTAEPQFGYYVNYDAAAGSNRVAPGQFRDVTVWPVKPEALGKLGLKPLD